MEKKSGLWFWILLIILIFVLYCLTMQRAFCQTLDAASLHAAMEAAGTSPGQPRGRDAGANRHYKTPSLFRSDTVTEATAKSDTPALSAVSVPERETLSWIPSDTLQPIRRPDKTVPEPFGYSLFATEDHPPSDPYANVVPDEYQLGAGDHVLVHLWGRVDEEYELIIDRSGRVFIPKAGQVMLAGLMVSEARAAINERLASIYSGFELAVTLGQLRTYRIYVFGEVRRPGAYTMGAAAGLVDALYRAGGPNERGTLRRVRLVRGERTTLIDLYEFLLTGRRTSDPRLAAGDVIFVDIAGPRAGARGRVKRPGIYELSGPTTLREFIELAGGFEADAYRDRIMIDRLQDSDGRQLIDVDLSGAIADGAAAALSQAEHPQHVMEPARTLRPAAMNSNQPIPVTRTETGTMFCEAPESCREERPFEITIGLDPVTQTDPPAPVYLDISFPQSPVVTIVSSPGWIQSGQRIFAPGEIISHAPDRHSRKWHKRAAQYRLVSLTGIPNYNETARRVTLRVAPYEGTRDLTVQYRATIGGRNYPDQGPKDQQNLWVYTRLIPQALPTPAMIASEISVGAAPAQPAATNHHRGNETAVSTVPSERYTLRHDAVPPFDQSLAVQTAAADTNDAGWDTPVFDGDDISVFSMIEARPNVVWLDGWVKHPGAFERGEGMTLGDLIDWGGQLKPGAYLERADLVRQGTVGSWQLIAVNLEDIVDQATTADIALQDGDRLTVYAREEVEQPRVVTIEGEVRKPGEYRLFESMRLSDLVFRAGNASREALLDAVEVARQDPEGRTRTLTRNLRGVLEHGDLSEDILLQEGDYVFIRRDPLAGAQRLVRIEGEVRYPGRYALLDEEETFYNVLQRAGGMTPQAFPRGALFIRSQISEDMKRMNYSQILINAQPLLKDSTGRLFREDVVEVDPELMTRIILDVPQILREQGGAGDVVMRPGDRVYIPARPSGIQLLGAVAAPGTIGFHNKWRVGDYISRAGGTTESSDKNGIRVIRADGQVAASKGKNLRVDLGDAIFVPTRVKKQTDWLKALTQTVSVVGGVATTVLVVYALGN